MYRLRMDTLLLACLIVFGSVGASTAAELRIPVIAYDQNQIALSGIVFTHAGIETKATVDSGLTEIVVILSADQEKLPEPGSAMELGLPGSLAKTWFLIDDTVHVPASGAPPAEVVLMRKADMRRLADEVRGEEMSWDDLSVEKQKELVLRMAQRYGFASATEFHAAVAAFKAATEDPMDKGIALYLSQEYVQAEPFFVDALGQAEEDLLEAAQYLGQTYFFQGKFGAAAEAFRKASALHDKNDTLFLSWLGLVLQHSGEMDKAEAALRQALALDESKHGPNSVVTAKRLNNLAMLLLRTDRLEEAEPLLLRALKIVEMKYGSENPKAVPYLNNLAVLFRQTQRWTEAEELFRRSIEVTESALEPGYEGPMAYGMLAALLRETSRPAEAEHWLRRGLEISRRMQGPEHPAIASTLYQLANLMESMDRLTAAEDFLEQAVEIWSARLHEDHPLLVTAQGKLEALEDQNRDREATPSPN